MAVCLPSPRGHELCFLPNGVLSLPRSRVIYGELSDERLLTPVYSVLLRTDDGDILYDTGIDPDAAYDPKALEGITRNLHSFTEEDDIRNRLRDVGTTEDQVRTVIMSHFHYDHVGGLRYFRNAKVYVQNNEYRAGMHPTWGWTASSANSTSTIRSTSRQSWAIPRSCRASGRCRRSATRRDTRACSWSCQTAAR